MSVAVRLSVNSLPYIREMAAYDCEALSTGSVRNIVMYCRAAAETELLTGSVWAAAQSVLMVCSVQFEQKALNNVINHYRLEPAGNSEGGRRLRLSLKVT